MEKKEVLEVLRSVYDPDYQDKSIVDLGLVGEEDIQVEGNRVEVQYRLTAPLCPFSAAIGIMMRYALQERLGVEANLRLDPSHTQGGLVNELLESREKSESLLQRLRDYGILERCVRIQDATP